MTKQCENMRNSSTMFADAGEDMRTSLKPGES